MSSEISKELEMILGCDIITTEFPRENIMQFYVFIDSDGKRSTQNYKIVICRQIKHITDLNVYVEYLMKCLASKIFVQGNVNSKSTVTYDIKTCGVGFDIEIYYEKIACNFYKESSELFIINEFISIKPSLETGTVFIQDKRYGNVLINFNTRTYSIDEDEVA